MDAQEAIERIKEITILNGYTYCPTVVTSEPTALMRGVQVTAAGEQVRVKINADGKCLESLTKTIQEKLGAGVTFAPQITEATDATT